MSKHFIILLLLTIFAAAAVSGQEKQAAPPDKAEEPAVNKANQRPENTAPKEKFDDADVKTLASQCVKLDTEQGTIEMEMFPESAPESVRNFLNLTSIGAFDTTEFSRVVPGFIIQGGNIATRETRTAELTRRAYRIIPDEPNPIKHERGIVSMARGTSSNTTSSNFFILVGSGSHLDGTFAAFGRVTKGMETVDLINKMPVMDEQPHKAVKIKTATVFPCTP